MDWLNTLIGEHRAELLALVAAVIAWLQRSRIGSLFSGIKGLLPNAPAADNLLADLKALRAASESRGLDWSKQIAAMAQEVVALDFGPSKEPNAK